MLPRWEQTYGSVTKGLFREKDAFKKGRKIINFRGGIETLTQALSAPLSGRIHTGSAVQHIAAGDDGFTIDYRQGREDHQYKVTHVIYTAPLHTLPGISWFDAVKEVASKVVFAPVRTLHLTVPQEALQMPDGFGFLVPSREQLSLLGCIFTSAIFPAKAPEGSALLTVMIGGAHRAGDLLTDPASLETKALTDLRDILHIRGDIRVLHGQTWARAIPQKNRGYDNIMQSLSAFEQAHPGFRFAGNGVSGVSVGDTMEFAAKVVHSMV
jgi:protoporphyrinogen/coproporphyrinogen III oxidase